MFMLLCALASCYKLKLNAKKTAHKFSFGGLISSATSAITKPAAKKETKPAGFNPLDLITGGTPKPEEGLGDKLKRTDAKLGNLLSKGDNESKMKALAVALAKSKAKRAINGEPEPSGWFSQAKDVFNNLDGGEPDPDQPLASQATDALTSLWSRRAALRKRRSGVTHN